ncbi:MAG: Fic family protein [Methylophilaceae bacterium]|uniref:Fic family protein n=1 Tax=Methylicorpusculum sp. TaxID=2713644 RepID=UPI00273233A3|nr:Fic family protein [Methylicorpusculum sp.]MDP3529491.1 Fic family protein [Methylicorpusculum sp.]MDZ4098015.1 Fic family protein [Methylophilaceae bacterium]
MIWNWQQADWPHFSYEKLPLVGYDNRLLLGAGLLFGAFKHLDHEEKNLLTIELISNEALKTSEIEGESLDRDSLQSSIRRQLGLVSDNRKIPPAEQGIAQVMVDLYQSFKSPLSHATLFNWHTMLTNSRRDLNDIGRYRTHKEPMQIVSGPIYSPRIHYEAPSSVQVIAEMDSFIDWFNATAPDGNSPLPALVRSGIAHLYFESIHPFEDGNGRIGRAIAEKALAQCLGQPTLIAIAHTIERNKKAYYTALEQANKSNEITTWLIYFADTVLSAQSYTQVRLEFLINKAKLYDRLRGQLNVRQEKVLSRMFREGPEGFKGGLSAEKYLSITGTTRPTATRDLQDLVMKGALLRTGERKHTRYSLNLYS